MMTRIFIVVEGGCVRYVSSTDDEVEVHVLDLDDRKDVETDVDFDIKFKIAESLERIW
jgi:hypothetical protein